MFSIVLAVLIALGCAEVDDGGRVDSPLPDGGGALVDTLDEAGLGRLFEAYRRIDIPPVDTTGSAAWVDSVVASLGLDQKIGQLFIVHLEAQADGQIRNSSLAAVRDLHVGGFLVPRLLEPEMLYRHTRRLQELSDLPLFMAADYERGVGRFNNPFTELPSNMALGATRDTALAAAAGRLTAIEARAIGVNMVFAPVVDVNNNPRNPIINIRSYGADPDLVGRMASAFVREAASHGLMTTLKHFPGHGNTDVDSHSHMGVIEGDRASLEAVELRPYRIVLDGPKAPAAIMSAHLWIEAIEPHPLPATFSRPILTDLLRDEMGFDGVVITDDIRMGALQSTYALDERIVRPLEAGVDVILTPENVERALAAVRAAVESGRLSEDRIDASVRRILRAKASAGLHRVRVPDGEVFEALNERPLGATIAKAIADRAVTLLKTNAALPLRPGDQTIGMVHLTNYRDSESIEAAMERLDGLLGAPGSYRYDMDPPADAIGEIVDQAREVDVLVLALYLRLQAGRGEAGLFPRQTNLVERLLQIDVPVVLITYGNPYAASDFQEADAIVVAYDQSLATIDATAEVLLGRQPAPGRLPIDVTPFDFGSGMDWVGGRRDGQGSLP